jgi:hypothetical protein
MAKTPSLKAFMRLKSTSVSWEAFREWILNLPSHFNYTIFST